MVSWCVLNKDILFKEASKQAKLEENLKFIWCHSNIFASNENFITWCFLLSMYVLSFVHLWRDCFASMALHGLYAKKWAN